MSNKKRTTGRPSRYPLEFQRDAVAMVLDEKRSIADVARSIGVIEGTLGNWVLPSCFLPMTNAVSRYYHTNRTNREPLTRTNALVRALFRRKSGEASREASNT